MSDIGNFDNSEGHTKRGPLTDEQRTRKQQRFLKAYCESGNIKASCKVAGIDRQTFYNWQKSDESFKKQVEEALPDVHDTLENAAYERAVKGIESYVVSMGRVVYEEIPVIDAWGNQEVDERGKPRYTRGKPVMERKYSDTLLALLLKANMPEKYKEQSKVEHSGSIDLTGARDRLLGKLAALPDEE